MAELVDVMIFGAGKQATPPPSSSTPLGEGT